MVLLSGFNLLVEPKIEHSLIYYPIKEIAETPASIGIQYEDITFKTPDGKNIYGWFMDNGDSEKVILYFHGNSGNISDNLAPVKTLNKLPADVLIIDYHGYGSSEGQPSEQNLYMDAKSAYAFLIDQKIYKPEQIYAYGYSLGGPVAAYLASTEKVGGLILEATFTSTKDFAYLKMPLYRPFLWMMKEDFNALEKMDKIHAPLLIIHRKTDQSVPYTMAEQLYAKAKEPKTLLLLEEGGHNDWIESKELLEGIRRFLKQ